VPTDARSATQNGGHASLCPPYGPEQDHAECFHQSGPAVRYVPVCGNRSVHLSKNIRQTTRWRVFQPDPQSRQPLDAGTCGNRMMSAANTPFIWLVRLQNWLFGMLREAAKS
jgi:hypothetical protein